MQKDCNERNFHVDRDVEKVDMYIVRNIEIPPGSMHCDGVLFTLHFVYPPLKHEKNCAASQS